MSKVALRGMKKIARGAPVDPEANLLSFLGVPSNFRKATSTSVSHLKKHSIEQMLSFPPPQAIYSMAQKSQKKLNTKVLSVPFSVLRILIDMFSNLLPTSLRLNNLALK